MKIKNKFYAAATAALSLCLMMNISCNDEPDEPPPIITPGGEPVTAPQEEPHVWAGAVSVIEKKQWGLVEYKSENDCSEETANANSAALQSAINSFTKAGQYRLKLEKGTYCLWGDSRKRENGEGGNSVRIPSYVEFDLGGSTLQLAAHARAYTSILRVEHSENVKIFGGELVGDRVTHDYETENSDHYGAGIWANSSMNVEMSGLVIREITGDCITVGEGMPKSRNVIIDNVKCSRARRDGFVAVNVNGLIIRNSHVFDIYNDVPLKGDVSIGAQACIAFEASKADGTHEITNIEIYNNVFNAVRGTETRQFFNAHSGTQNVVLRDNELIGHYGLRYGKNILFKSNKISDGTFLLGGAVNNTWSHTGFGENFIFENNDFRNVTINGATGGTDERHPDQKQNFAFIGNRFYNTDISISSPVSTALIDNEFFDTDGTMGHYVGVSLNRTPVDGELHEVYFVNNTAAPQKDEAKRYYPNYGGSNFSTSAIDEPPNTTLLSPSRLPDWFYESSDRAEAEMWVKSWIWYGGDTKPPVVPPQMPNDDNGVPSVINADGTFTDARDNKVYRTVKIGDLLWMAENLNYKVLAGEGSWCYQDDDSNCDTYGRYYDWTTAMDIDRQYLKAYWNGNSADHRGVCPAGWRLPDKRDFDNLAAAAGGRDVAGPALKSASSNWFTNTDNGASHPTNDAGFEALPGSYRRTDNDGYYYPARYNAYFWSAAEYGRDYPQYLFLDWNNDEAARAWNVSKTSGLSVRCVKR